MKIEDIESLETLQNDIHGACIKVAKVNANIRNRRVARKLLATFGALQDAGYLIEEIVNSIGKVD